MSKFAVDMWETMQGIVLNVLRYSDKNSIAHMLTRQRGRMAFLVPQGSTKGARMRNSMVMPLSVVEFEARIMPGRDLHSFKDCRRLDLLAGIYGDPVKSAVVMFVSEVLTHSIQESEQNEALFEYVRRSIGVLDMMESGAANFHICFLYHLGAFLGIQPDVETWQDGYWFDMQNGVFTPSRPLFHALAPDEARVVALISRMTFKNLHLFRFSRADRNRILDIILSYLRIHNSSLGTLRSLEVLRALF
ncbi:MAG: recombination protein O N-terminal domain-containing protein [Muribaculaceae bacterium]|nr:recombination protein O N-terminal domain-containing protein [Muribaculaceae bacterium]